MGIDTCIKHCPRAIHSYDWEWSKSKRDSVVTDPDPAQGLQAAIQIQILGMNNTYKYAIVVKCVISPLTMYNLHIVKRKQTS